MIERKLDMRAIQEKLETQRLELQRQIARQAPVRESVAVGESDRSALAQNYMAHQQRSNSLARAERKLEQVVTALQRIDQGNYGLCAVCKEMIKPGRLEAIPHTALCIQCKAKREHKRGITI